MQVHILNASLCVQKLYIMLHVKWDIYIGKKVVYELLEPYHMALPGDGHLTWKSQMTFITVILEQIDTSI